MDERKRRPEVRVFGRELLPSFFIKKRELPREWSAEFASVEEAEEALGVRLDGESLGPKEKLRLTLSSTDPVLATPLLEVVRKDGAAVRLVALDEVEFGALERAIEEKKEAEAER